MNRCASRHFQPFSGQDIRTLVGARARTRADHPYLVWRPFSGDRRVWTYAQFAERVARFAAGLRARGVQAGDRVLVHLDNCPEAVFAWFGCAWMGAVAVTTNARSSGDEVPVAFVRCSLPAGEQRSALVGAIEAACASALADFKRPREIRVVDELPRSTLEKIAKAQLRRLLAAERPAS